MYLARTPALIKPLLKEFIWHMTGSERTVYLTFDDGPIPEVTPWVLDTLAEYEAHATFFCIGRNAQENPGLLARIRAEGHSVGNHTYAHSNGWNTPTPAYLRDVLLCQSITGTKLFRPPYGRISREQSRALGKRFSLIMWDVLSGDFDTTIDGARCLRNVVDHCTAGSIIVFHDSLKAEPRLRTALPLALDHLVKEGYALHALPEHGLTGSNQ
jgi:peptidoglycan/xylan/chitin deacetylase (PgdA/CDA1 family)